jgi:hypothetical protein
LEVNKVDVQCSDSGLWALVFTEIHANAVAANVAIPENVINDISDSLGNLVPMLRDMFLEVSRVITICL